MARRTLDLTDLQGPNGRQAAQSFVRSLPVGSAYRGANGSVHIKVADDTFRVMTPGGPRLESPSGVVGTIMIEANPSTGAATVGYADTDANRILTTAERAGFASNADVQAAVARGAISTRRAASMTAAATVNS